MSLLTNKTLFITGDTGSLRIFSRDEKKQDDMRHEYRAKYPEYAEEINSNR